MILVNLTTHAVGIMPDRKTAVLTLPTAGFARVDEIRARSVSIVVDGQSVPVTRLHYGPDIEGLPAEHNGVGYVVSTVTASAALRPDLYFPLDEVRGEGGQIIGCRALGQFLPQ